ncbi:MAG: hypothetical protein HFH48_09600 [Lachnospiraceae bacterium]|nr:hypothetical protein [Lachnospiraceae bacterium]
MQLGEQKEWIEENTFCERMIPKKEIFMSMLEKGIEQIMKLGIAFHKKRVDFSYSFDK